MTSAWPPDFLTAYCSCTKGASLPMAVPLKFSEKNICEQHFRSLRCCLPTPPPASGTLYSSLRGQVLQNEQIHSRSPRAPLRSPEYCVRPLFCTTEVSIR